MQEKVYNVKEIAVMERVSVQTVYRWCADGFLSYARRPSKTGKGGILVDESDYREFRKLFRRHDRSADPV